jgi:hypothetical protein
VQEADGVSSHARAGGQHAVPIDLRPKRLWVPVFVALALLSIADALSGGGWKGWVGVVAFGAMVPAAFRSTIHVEDDVLYRRLLLGWEPLSLDLRQLERVAFRRSVAMGQPLGMHLLLVDRDRHAQVISLLWWSNWEELAALVARAVLTRQDSASGGLVSMIDIDRASGRRLAAYF